LRVGEVTATFGVATRTRRRAWPATPWHRHFLSSAACRARSARAGNAVVVQRLLAEREVDVPRGGHFTWRLTSDSPHAPPASATSPAAPSRRGRSTRSRRRPTAATASPRAPSRRS